MAALVQNGGAGTVAAGLKAGIPAVIVPFFGDQPFWGRRLAHLGVGPAPIPQKALASARLAAALHLATTDATMRQRAAELGRRVRAENGVAAAAAFVDQHLRQHKGETLGAPTSE